MTSSSSMRSERMSKLRIRGKCLKEAKTQTNTLTSQTMRKVRMMRPKIKLNRRKSVKRRRKRRKQEKNEQPIGRIGDLEQIPTLVTVVVTVEEENDVQ